MFFQSFLSTDYKLFMEKEEPITFQIAAPKSQTDLGENKCGDGERYYNKPIVKPKVEGRPHMTSATKHGWGV